MGKNTKNENNEKIYETARRFLNDCLCEDGSLLWSGKDIWNKENLKEFQERVVEKFDSSKDSFDEKLKKQLDGAEDDIHKLAAEILCVYFLFLSNVKSEKKFDNVKKSLNGKVLNSLKIKKNISNQFFLAELVVAAKVITHADILNWLSLLNLQLSGKRKIRKT